MVVSAERGEEGKKENRRGDKMEGRRAEKEKRGAEKRRKEAIEFFFYQLHISNG